MNLFDSLSDTLINKNIKPSIPRIRILEYMLTQRNHPTADQLYQDIKAKIKTISRATVYNTLSLFAGKGLIRILSFENNETRYEISSINHGHFICESCGSITDFKINIDDFKIDIDNCIISQKDVYFKGICSQCLLLNK